MALAAMSASTVIPAAARLSGGDRVFSASCPGQREAPLPATVLSPIDISSSRLHRQRARRAPQHPSVSVRAQAGPPEAAEQLPAALRADEKVPEKKAGGSTIVGEGDEDRVVEIHTKVDFDAALRDAKNKLVVVEYAASHSRNSARMYPSMVELSKQTEQVVCLLVMGDESPETEALCRAASIEKVPYFVFYKNGQKVHEEQGVDPEMLIADVFYYGDNDAPVQQLKSIADVEGLLQAHSADGKLVVIDVSLKSCGPCVKVYPTVLKLSKKMGETAVFARLFGDESTDTGSFMKKMGVVEVPTFLFIRDGKLCGRYVGSGRGELIGEVLRYSGVRVTY